MIKALQETAWVQSLSSQGQAEGWISREHGVVAVKSDTHVSFHDNAEQILYDFRVAEGVVYQKPLADEQVWNWEQALLSLLTLDKSIAEMNLGDSLGDIHVVSESWRRIENNQDDPPLVELDVTLRAGANAQVRLLFLLDADTHLPTSCRVLSSGTDASVDYKFLYPSQGPRSVFALGVPPGAEVVVEKPQAALPASAGMLPTESPRMATRSPIEKIAEQTLPDALDRIIAVDELKKLEPTESESEIDMELSLKQAASLDRPPFESQPVLAPLPKPLAPDQLIAEINSQLSTYWQVQGIQPAEPSTDIEFLRRVYLDLTGRIPMVSEVYHFLEDESGSRREHLVDKLLGRRDHATHLAAVWRTMLLPDSVDVSIYGGTGKFDEWLADRFGANVPYNQLVAELLSAEGRVSESGPLLFYASLKLNPEEIAAKTSRAFLGMRMECAQCHDHPFDDSISQLDFWGFAAHFAQISRPKGKMEMTSAVLQVRDNSFGEVMIPDFDEIVAPRLPQLGFTVPTTSADGASRRRQLVDWLTSPHNTRFCRATVNRVWEHLFGRGLVMPVDDMHADIERVCPELLKTLSRELAASDFDLRKLLRALVLSDAYQLSSRAVTDDPAQALAFARMNIKSFSADQLFDCIAVATQNKAMLTDNVTLGTLARFDNRSRQAFIEQFRAPPGQRTDYHAGIPQALALMHGGLVHGATDVASSGLLKSLEAPFFKDQQRVETLFLATLSRFPNDAELARMLQHLGTATDRPTRQKALGDVLWALLNSAEFTFIH